MGPMRPVVSCVHARLPPAGYPDPRPRGLTALTSPPTVHVSLSALRSLSLSFFCVCEGPAAGRAGKKPYHSHRLQHPEAGRTSPGPGCASVEIVVSSTPN